MSEALDHQKRFQTAVDVIHNLPKDGSYRPSYKVMLNFYSLYKQAMCGPCNIPRPGFWDPVGRYKWDAWNRLGEMKSEKAMAEYVEEMKKVAQQVIDTIPMNEKTASLFHHFEPLYVVIHDMPRPPVSLLSMIEEAGDGKSSKENPSFQGPDVDQETCQTPEVTSTSQPQDILQYEGVVLTSDSESEIFCDSVELLDNVKVDIPKSNGLYSGHPSSGPSSVGEHQESAVPQATQMGAGKGGEGAEDRKAPPIRRSRAAGRNGMQHGWRERGVTPGGPRQVGGGGAEFGGGAGRGGGDGSEGGAERLQDVLLQQQIVLALQRLREDMRSVMDRLEVVERLAAAHFENTDWRPCIQHNAAPISESEGENWWPFDVSVRTLILLLLWPVVAQGLVFLLRRGQRKHHIPM
ncbi:acyl-CoA-binding domain-containing protein 4 isoform X1 [Osmerus mordax]|uniref:acyl-CoA-binding domain-containing protein 4 isoform X1 n=1 Tax=Osmerus mordax TaxID=8014 RepID=UPI00350F37A7